MPDKRLLNQLDSLFAGVSEPAVPTAPAARARRAPADRSEPSGWVWEIDTDGKCLWSSDEVYPLLGFRPRELQGKPLSTGGLPANPSNGCATRWPAAKPSTTSSCMRNTAADNLCCSW